MVGTYLEIVVKSQGCSIIILDKSGWYLEFTKKTRAYVKQKNQNF